MDNYPLLSSYPMSILQPLIDSTHFKQAEPLWQEGVAQDVFELFFACVLANMSRQVNYLAYQDFIEQTQNAFEMSKDGGHVAPALLTFWEKPEHKQLRQKIAETVLLSSDELSAPLVLALHTGMASLHKLSMQYATTPPAWIGQHLTEITALLPSWADTVLDKAVLARLDVAQVLSDVHGGVVDSSSNFTPNATTSPSFDEIANDGLINDRAVNEKLTHQQAVNRNQAIKPKRQQNTQSNHIGNQPINNHASIAKPPAYKTSAYRTPKGRNPWTMTVGLCALLLMVGGGGYYYVKQKTAINSTSSLAVQALPSSQLSITIKDKGELYACHAKVGSSELSAQLVALIQANFAHTLCVIDVDENLAKTLPLDKLTSVLALLQTVPYATLEMNGDKVYINAPNNSDISRLVADIGALLPTMQVAAMPALNAEQAINESVQAATQALNALPDNADAFALARALSMQLIDTAKGDVPAVNQAVLKLAADRLKNAANTRLLVVAHSDESGDLATLRMQSQMMAEAVKRSLVGYGATETQLVAIGVGADFPLADNQTDIGRFKNRRVEFLVYDEAIVRALTRPNAQSSYIAESGADGLDTQYEVINGKIVPKGSLDNETIYVADDINPNAAGASAFAPPTASPSTAAPPPATSPASNPSASNTSSNANTNAEITAQIDEELLRPISVEPLSKGQSVELLPDR